MTFDTITPPDDGATTEAPGGPVGTPPGYDWEPEALDLDAYLLRIGYDGPLEPTLETLRGMQRAHTTAVPFENLTVQLDGEPPLDLASLQGKISHGGRGGYCYEQNILFGTVLTRLGFRVTSLAARMLMGDEESTTRAAGHAVLRVDVAGRAWLVDVGVGMVGSMEPVEIADGIQATHEGGWRYRMDQALDGMWVLRQWATQDWFTLYKFTLSPAYRADYVDANYIAAFHPRSAFSHRLIAQRNGAEVRHSLAGLELSATRPGERAETRQLEPGELPGVLRDVFGIHLSEEQYGRLPSPS